MIYVGDNLVIESIADGVVLRPIQEALAAATFAVALRYQHLDREQALNIRDFAGRQLSKPFNFYGIFQQAAFRLDLMTFCGRLSGEELQECRQWAGRVNLGTETNNKWFCSELVIASYASAGAPLTKELPNWASPNDLIQLQSTGKLAYVGHLKTS